MYGWVKSRFRSVESRLPAVLKIISHVAERIRPGGSECHASMPLPWPLLPFPWGARYAIAITTGDWPADLKVISGPLQDEGHVAEDETVSWSFVSWRRASPPSSGSLMARPVTTTAAAPRRPLSRGSRRGWDLPPLLSPLPATLTPSRTAPMLLSSVSSRRSECSTPWLHPRAWVSGIRVSVWLVGQGVSELRLGLQRVGLIECFRSRGLKGSNHRSLRLWHDMRRPKL